MGKYICHNGTNTGPDTDFWYVCNLTLTLEIWLWVKVMTRTWVMDNNCVKILSRSNLAVRSYMARTRIFGMRALWLWSWRYDLVLRSWHTHGSWTISVWNTIQIQLCNDELWPGHGLSVYAHCDLDLGDVTLCQGHCTPLGHGQQLIEILSRSMTRTQIFLCMRALWTWP